VSSDASLFANVMTKPPPPLRAHLKEGVPPGVEAVILKCLRRPREERYPAMTALTAELRSGCSGLGRTMGSAYWQQTAYVRAQPSTLVPLEE
jgi:hypothetical protein